MKRLAAALLLVLAPACSLADWYNPLSSIIGEWFYSPVANTVKVPVFSDCPSYATWFSAAEKKQTKKMAEMAKYSYLESESNQSGTIRDPGNQDAFMGQSLLGALALSDLLGSVAADFVITADGVINVPGSGFQAEIFKDPVTKRLTLAFRGSEPLDFADWGTDALQALGGDTTQYAAAAKLLGALLANTTEPIDVVGHSLGGGLAQYAMASNDCQGRVEGYTFNAAGLSDDTVASLSPERIAAAAEHLTNVRVQGDIVSFVGSHIGNIFDVEKASGTGNAHRIETVITSLNAIPDTDGPGKALAPKAGADGGDPAAFLSQWLGEGLADFLPPELAGPLLQALEECVRAKILSELLEQAGVVDATLREWAVKIAELEAKLRALLPDDASRAAMDALLADVATGNWEHLSDSSKELAYALADHYVDKALRDAGVGKLEREAILKAYREALDEWFSGGDAVGSFTGNFSTYVYDKIRAEVGEKAANSWKDVWNDFQTGADPWSNFGKATLDTIEYVGMRELKHQLDHEFERLAKKHPWLAQFCADAGINADSVHALAQDIWGVVRSDGDFADKVEGIAEATAETMWEWFGKFVKSLTDRVMRLALAAVDWLASQIHELLEKLDGYAQEIRDKGFHPQYAELVEWARSVRASRDGDSVLVVDFAADGAVEFQSGDDAWWQTPGKANAHDETLAQ